MTFVRDRSLIEEKPCGQRGGVFVCPITGDPECILINVCGEREKVTLEKEWDLGIILPSFVHLEAAGPHTPLSSRLAWALLRIGYVLTSDEVQRLMCWSHRQRRERVAPFCSWRGVMILCALGEL